MDKATPRPWLREGRTIYALQDIKWNGKPAQTNRFSASVQGNGPVGANDEELEANAALIVRAVNSHDQLVGALEWYAEQARLARLMTGEGDDGRHAIAHDGGNRARAALKSAKGGA